MSLDEITTDGSITDAGWMNAHADRACGSARAVLGADGTAA